MFLVLAPPPRVVVAVWILNVSKDHMVSLVLFFETGCDLVAQATLELTLLQPLEC